MRFVLPSSLRANVLPTLTQAMQYVRRVDRPYVRFALPVVGWLVAGFTPLVAFDAGGGQTAIGIVRYVVFRGLDRDVWNAAGTVFVLIGVLAASAIMIGLVLHSTGFLFKDKRLTFWGCGVVMVSLISVVLAARPVASITLFGLAALPHIGWWLMLIHAALTLWLASQWTTAIPTQEGPQSAHRRRGWRRPRRVQRLR